METPITAESLALFAGTLLTIAFLYIPGLREKYAALAEVYKQLIMLGCLVLAVGLIILVSCLNWWAVIICDKPSIIALIKLLVMAVIANQSFYKILPTPTSVKTIKTKAERKVIRAVINE
jgi:hypothetical protein